MRKQNIVYSADSADEKLVIEHFRKTTGLSKLETVPCGTKNVDAPSRNGVRHFIRTLCSAKKTGTTCSGAGADDRDKRLFECILVEKLAEDWLLGSFHQLGWSGFIEVRL